MDYVLSRPQSEFFTSSSKSVAAVAGFGAGKTEVALIRMFVTMSQYPKANMLYLAPTFPLIRDIWYPKVESLLDEHNFSYNINKGENVIYIEGLGKIFCRTMEHPHRIIGFEVLDAFLDELDVLPEEKAMEVWRKTKARCRQKIEGKSNQMYVTTTPEGFKATYRLFKRDPIEGSHLIQMSTYSNQHNLTDDYIDELMSNYPSQLISAYIMGEFVNLTSGSVYPSFSRKLNHANINAQDNDFLYIGMDFNVGKMSSVVHVLRQGRPCAVRELTDIEDTPAMIRAINNVYPNHEIAIYPDASGAARKSVNAGTSDLKLLSEAGFQVRVNYSNPAIRDRINSMNAMFVNAKGERRYFINVDKCPKYVDSLEQQAYDKNGLPDKQNDFDHLPDGAGYYIERDFGISKPGAQTSRIIM